MSNFIQFQITFPNQSEAEILARRLLEKHMVACVQIVGPIQSFYRWKDKLQNETEFLLLAKTKSLFFNEISDFINEFHSYECPQIIALPIENISQKYENWLNQQFD